MGSGEALSEALEEHMLVTWAWRCQGSKASGPWGNDGILSQARLRKVAMPSLLVQVLMYIVCTENIQCSFLPAPLDIYSLRTSPLNRLLLPTLAKPVSSTQLYAINPPPYLYLITPPLCSLSIKTH